MARALREHWGNPSSVHAEGAAARAAVERARESVAALLAVQPGEVFCASGASEANNTALTALALRDASRRHLVTTSVEHPSVEAPLAALEGQGLRVTRVAVDREGLVDLDALAGALGRDTALVSIL